MRLAKKPLPFSFVIYRLSGAYKGAVRQGRKREEGMEDIRRKKIARVSLDRGFRVR